MHAAKAMAPNDTRLVAGSGWQLHLLEHSVVSKEWGCLGEATSQVVCHGKGSIPSRLEGPDVEVFVGSVVCCCKTGSIGRVDSLGGPSVWPKCSPQR